MIWPCAIFSDRSVIDPSYNIKGIPTFVLLDRGGIVRFIQMGIGQEKQKRRVIDKLILKVRKRSSVPIRMKRDIPLPE